MLKDFSALPEVDRPAGLPQPVTLAGAAEASIDLNSYNYSNWLLGYEPGLGNHLQTPFCRNS